MPMMTVNDPGAPSSPLPAKGVGTQAAVATTEVIEIRVAAGVDDAEELDSGAIYGTSTDLELVVGVGGTQMLGL